MVVAENLQTYERQWAASIVLLTFTLRKILLFILSRSQSTRYNYMGQRYGE